MTEDLSRMPLISPQSATVVILTMMIQQTKNLVSEKFIEESKIALDNAKLLENARNRQIEILTQNLKYAKERDK